MISDLEARHALKYKDYCIEASGRHNVPVPLLFAIGSRESRWTLALTPSGDPGGTGDFTPRPGHSMGEMPPDGRGWGRGVMQIDYAAHVFAQSGPWMNPRRNILYASRVFDGYRNRMKQLLGEDHPLFYNAVIAAYNAGPGRPARAARQGRHPDSTTTGGDYSEYVLDLKARMDEFIDKCDWEDRCSDDIISKVKAIEPAPLQALVSTLPSLNGGITLSQNSLL